ncbi:GNAT family N-acetyltransferase [Candidatus Hodarchaeum mangrovi]
MNEFEMFDSMHVIISEKLKLVLRYAEKDDLEFISILSVSEMDNVVTEAWQGKFNWKSWFRDIAEAIEDQFQRVFIILIDELSIGYLWLNEEPEILWITGFVIGEKWQHKGVGKEIMDYLIEESKKANKRGIELGVQRNNLKALNFYKKLGFRPYEYLKYANTDLVRLRLIVPDNLTYY